LLGFAAASVAIHLSLLALSGPNGGPGGVPGSDFGQLHIALDPLHAVHAVDPRSSEPPSTLVPARFAPPPRYPKLLELSAIDIPRSELDESQYHALSELTAMPTAAQEIDIAYPRDQRMGLLVAALTLFIDEDGTVALVRAGDPRAPADYERAAIDAFSKARFHPGMSGKHPVKTRMVIRVAFENGPGGPQSSAGIHFR
jgi:hypothetical protein